MQVHAYTPKKANTHSW